MKIYRLRLSFKKDVISDSYFTNFNKAFEMAEDWKKSSNEDIIPEAIEIKSFESHDGCFFEKSTEYSWS